MHLGQPERCLPPLKTRRGTNTIPLLKVWKWSTGLWSKEQEYCKKRQEVREIAQGLCPSSACEREKSWVKPEIFFSLKLSRETLRLEQNCRWIIQGLYQGRGVGKRCWHHWATWHHGVWVLSELQRKHSLLSVSMVHVIRKTLKRVRAPWWHHREGWGALCSLAGAQAGQGRRGGAEWVGRVLVWEHLQCNSFQGHPGIMRREGCECEWGTWNLTVLCSKPPNTDASWTRASGQGPDSGHVEWRCSWQWRPTSDVHTTVGGGEAPGESLVRSPSWLIRIQRLVLRKLSLCVHFEVSEGSWFPPLLLFLLPPTLRVDSCPWFWISSNEAHLAPAFSSN